MKKAFAILSIATLAMLAGCSTADKSQQAAPQRTELSERQVLGLHHFSSIDKSDISATLKKPGRFMLHSGSKILLAQSGYEAPDHDLIVALAKFYTPIPITGNPDSLNVCLNVNSETLNYNYDDLSGGTGVPENSHLEAMSNGVGNQPSGGNVNDSIRKAATEFGADTIIVVWNAPGKKGVPNFRAAVINARSGKWEIVSPYAAGGPDEGKPAPKTDAEKAAAYKVLTEILSGQPAAK